MGTWRYYMCPEGIITLDDLPHGWGLLWVNKRGHVKPMAGHICPLLMSWYGHMSDLAWMWAHEVNTTHELEMLSHLLARVGDPEEVNRKIRDYSLGLANAQKELERVKTQYQQVRFKSVYEPGLEGRFLEAVAQMIQAKAGGQLDISVIDNLISVAQSLPPATQQLIRKRV